MHHFCLDSIRPQTYGSDWDSWMNRSYTAQSPYSLTPTERIRSRYGGGYATDEHDDLRTDALPAYPADDYGSENFDDHEFDDYDFDDYDIDEARIDRRWMWIAGVTGAILFVSVIIASLILGGGDSGSVSATVVSTEPTTSAAAPAPSPTPRVAAPPAMPSLPAETVITVTPAPDPTAQTQTARPAPPLIPDPQASAPPPPAVPGTVTYRITGEKRLIDMVTVIYTDQQGALVTDVNVSLPWSKSVVLNPGVTLSSVTATSVAGKLNCSITDANGALIAVQNSNSIITNCTR